MVLLTVDATVDPPKFVKSVHKKIISVRMDHLCWHVG